MFLTVIDGSQYSILAPNEKIVFTNPVLMEKNCRYLPRRTLKSWKHPKKTGWSHSLHGTGVPQNWLEELNHTVSELERIWENILSTSADKETEIQSDGTQPVSRRAKTEGVSRICLASDHWRFPFWRLARRWMAFGRGTENRPACLVWLLYPISRWTMSCMDFPAWWSSSFWPT